MFSRNVTTSGAGRLVAFLLMLISIRTAHALPPEWIKPLGYQAGHGGNERVYRLLTEPKNDDGDFRQQVLEACEAVEAGGFDLIAFDVWAWGHISVGGRFPGVDEPTPRGTVRARKQVIDKVAEVSLASEVKAEEQLRCVKLAWLLRLMDPANVLFTPSDNIDAIHKQDLRYTHAMPPVLLQDIEKSIVSSSDGDTQHKTSVALTLQALIERPIVDAKSDEAVEQIIRDVGQHLASNPDYRSSHSVVHMLWQTRCLAEARRDGVSVQRIKDGIDRLLPQSTHPLVQKWLEEARTQSGPAPKRPAVLVITNPNQLKPREGP